MPCPFGVCGLGAVAAPALYAWGKTLEPKQAVAVALAVPVIALVAAMLLAPEMVTSNFNCMCECSTMKSTAMGAGVMYLAGVKSLSEGSPAKVEEKLA